MQQDQQLRAGVAKSDITTDEPGVAINDPLYARALVLDDGATRVVIISLDATAIGGIGDINDDFVPRLRERIHRELSIEGSHVLIHATHTHPPGRLLCNDSEQLDRTYDAVRRACQNMIAVRVGSGVGHEDRFQINRTFRLKSGTSWTIRHANPCPPDDEVESIGEIDPEIGIVRIDRLDGRPLAVLFNFACHPLLGVRRAVTADYPGFACGVIEETLGNDVMALFIQGAAGDVTEVLYKDVSRPRDGKPNGAMLGLSTLKAWNAIETADAKLSVASQTIRLPRRTDIPQCIAALEQQQAELLASLRHTSLNLKTFLPLYLKYALSPDYPLDYAYRYLHAESIGSADLLAIDQENRANIEKYLRNIGAMERLAKIQDEIATLRGHQKFNDDSGERTIAAEVQGIKIGDCVLISAPLEVCTQVGLNVKRASPYEHTFVAAFSNGYLHYGPDVSEYGKGGYEVTECLLDSEWQQAYEKTADEIIRSL